MKANNQQESGVEDFLNAVNILFHSEKKKI